MSELRQQREGFFGTIRRIICRLLCDEGPPPPPPGPPPQEKTISFAPGHVGILAEYPPDLELTKQEIVKRVGDRLDRLELKQRETVNLAPGRVTIMRGPRLTLAWVLGDVPEARQNPARLIRFISELHEAIKKPPLEGRGYDPGPQEGPKSDRPDQAGADSVQRAAPEAGAQPGAPGAASQPSALARAARAPGAAAIRKLEADPDGFDLRAASPNWLSSGAQNHIGGGPGARPAEVSSVAPNALGPQPWEFEPLPPDLQPPGNPPAQPVEVAILDTVPSMASLLSAYTTWVGNDSTQPPQPPLQPQNPLLKGLLSDAGTGAFNVLDQTSTPANVGPAGQLDVVYSSNLPAVQLADHQYSMASHGLFIAGIIRSLAPQAKLRLIQVLNDDCGGSLYSVAHGLEVATQPGRTTPLVINCSLVLNIPRPNDPTSSDLQGVDQPTIDSLTQGMHDIFAWANQSSNVVIAAAAGNTGSGGSHPLARFPAALQDVAGVAALKQDDNDSSTPPAITDYSDQADDQADEGLAAFGGETDSTITPLTASSATGMLGVFIDPYPVPSAPPNTSNWTPNTSGWARWAGTSFAAPIVSAALANLIGRGTSPFGAIQQLRSRTPADPQIGNVIELRQGP